MKINITIKFRERGWLFNSVISFHSHRHAKQYILKDIDGAVNYKILLLEGNIIRRHIFRHNIQKESS